MTSPFVPTILVATNHLQGWSGSETLVLALVKGLLERQCRVVVYARHLDQAWGDRYIDPRASVTDDINTIGHIAFDVAHVQHSPVALVVRATFPDLPMLFSSLGVLPFLEQPPPFDVGISTYLAISEEVRDNLVSHGIAASEIEVLGNIVDEKLFSPSRPLGDRPLNILVLSYKIGDAEIDVLRSAAERIGAGVEFIGRSGRTIPNNMLPERINQADVVVSLGRGVIEAMLCGRVPLVFDAQGGDGLVTPQNLDKLSLRNFSGRTLRKKFSADEMTQELLGYRPEYGEELRKLATMRFGLAASTDRILSIYQRIADTCPTPVISDAKWRIIRYFRDASESDRRFAAWLPGEVLRIKSSVSWRITAPLRAARTLFRSTLQRLSSARAKQERQ